MPRKPRFNLPGMPQYVIQRGNNREPCFYADCDYLFYLEAMESAGTKYGCRIHAYVLMTNHVHLLVTPTAKHGISRLMQDLGRKYVRYFNSTYRRAGTLWEGRYKASLVAFTTVTTTRRLRSLGVGHIPGREAFPRHLQETGRVYDGKDCSRRSLQDLRSERGSGAGAARPRAHQGRAVRPHGGYHWR